MPRFSIGEPIDRGVFDDVEIEPSGQLRIEGWTREQPAGLEFLIVGVPHNR